MLGRDADVTEPAGGFELVVVEPDFLVGVVGEGAGDGAGEGVVVCDKVLFIGALRGGGVEAVVLAVVGEGEAGREVCEDGGD